MNLIHQDANGVELQVGDAVVWQGREGVVLLLEDWDRIGGPSDRYPREGVYVSGIGTWGDCKAVPAREVTKEVV